MNGVDVIAFTGGIGENHALIRELALDDMDYLGIVLDKDTNQSIKKEGCISSSNSRVQVYVINTNEEIIVARKAKALLEQKQAWKGIKAWKRNHIVPPAYS